MSARSQALTLVPLLSAFVACQRPESPSEAAVTTPTTSMVSRSEAVTAAPTGERGIYQIHLGLERVTQVRVVSTEGDAADGRTLDPTHWSFDTAAGRLRVDEPVDDAHESVVALGARRRPPEWWLREDVDPDSVRVVVGDRLGVEGLDYALDRESGLLRLLGTDTPEAPLRYYVQYSLRPDPAHPERTLGVALGNHGDQQAVRRLLGIEPP